MNHTSDQHEWFQRSRRAKPGEPWRDWYVWSDTPDRYKEARIIFQDFETSNWSWDPVANAYFWHRCDAHQPDLNFDNPEVGQAMVEVLDFWLSMGVDGLRLDAVHALHDERAVHLLEDLATVADEISVRSGIPRCLVAESDRNDPATVAPRAGGGVGGLGLHGQWADDVHHALHVLLTGEDQGYYADFADPGAVPKVLGSTPFYHDGTWSSFRGRRDGRPVDPAVPPGWRSPRVLHGSGSRG